MFFFLQSYCNVFLFGKIHDHGIGCILLVRMFQTVYLKMYDSFKYSVVVDVLFLWLKTSLKFKTISNVKWLISTLGFSNFVLYIQPY